MRERIYWSFFVFLIVLFVINLFINISHPLLWNDEGETVMFGERILSYGYPKVSDGKNILNLTEVPDKGVGVKEGIDAWIHLGWLQYYASALGVFIARMFDSPYVKTAFLRMPFAVFGLGGVFVNILLIFLLPIRRRGKLFVASFFIFIELLSVFLVLHLREARHYSLTYFLSSLAFFIYVRYRFFEKGKKAYFLILPFVLVFLFNSFFPVFITVTFYFLIYEFFMFLIRKTTMKSFVPLILSVVFVVPFLLFYETLYVSSEVGKYFASSFFIYFKKIMFIFEFLVREEFLIVLLTMKILISGFIQDNFLKFYKNNKLFQISTFLTGYILFFSLMIARMPYLFERYLVSLQPVVAMIIAIDFLVFYEILSRQGGKIRHFLLFAFSSFLIGGLFKAGNLSGRVYELTHEYQGPVDYIVSYIKENYEDSENLVIATNYEEHVLMYYLGSRVVVGYVGNNIEEDSLEKPDIVIPRRGRPNNREILHSFLDKWEYEEVRLPVFDYYYNNIPELGSHLFKTMKPDAYEDYLTFYILKE